MELVNCKDCGRNIPAERRVVSDENTGLPVVRKVVLVHEDRRGEGDLCVGSGKEAAGGEAQAVAA